jgi:single-strand DNA-binding protein
MASSSTIVVLGNLGRKPSDISIAANGSPMTDFSIAVTNRMGKDNQITTWYMVRVFGKLAEQVFASLDKGSPALVTGRHQVREYTDKSGEKRFSNEILATDVTFVGPKAQTASGGGGAGSPTEDDIPF